MISTMRERMSAKMGNRNDNAFKARKLFKMYDEEGSGMVGRWGGAGQGQGGTESRGGLQARRQGGPVCEWSGAGLQEPGLCTAAAR